MEYNFMCVQMAVKVDSALDGYKVYYATIIIENGHFSVFFN